ncbi:MULTISPECIES: class II fructose-bisphosphatase [Rhodomicrobium]|uniref:class II fructose-bisphosphatase n=1 Tax=Rhodomicrobium TaxID=1068 RepID=UPI000B4B73C9|nr:MULTISPECIES: class II fructose-bisphosphatase [Rhodomicrobium]
MSTDQPKTVLQRSLSIEVARVTEAAAIAAGRLRGRGNEADADRAAVDAMRRELNKLNIRGKVVIGEGERDEAPMLYIGEELGTGNGPEVDIAVDPLEGTTLCAKAMPNALAVLAMAEGGTLLNAPDIYMDKIAIGPGYPDGLVDLDRSPTENLRRLAEAKGVKISDLTVCILDRSRHGKLIDEVRQTGAAINLIGDGDIAGIIQTVEAAETDIYIGIGGAPEGVLAASALRCIGGQMQGRLTPLSEDERKRAEAMGLTDLTPKYSIEQMARGDVIFAATGVTDGSLLSGVKFSNGRVETHTVIMRAATKTVRWLRTQHRAAAKFPLSES